MAVQSFSDKDTERFYITGRPSKNKGWCSVKRIALRKLDMLNYAVRIEDLRSPPGNKLKRLRGTLSGFWSIRINDRWRIVFRWTSSGASDVRIDDYH